MKDTIFYNHLIKEKQLSTGARLLFVVIPHYPFSIVSAWFRAGARFDPVGKEGLAHILEHILFLKTKKYSNVSDRLKKIESLGIASGAFTTNEITYYYHIQDPETLMKSTKLLIDGVSSSFFDKKDVVQEKKIIMEEESENRNTPESYLWRISQQGMWPNTDLGRNFFGTHGSRKNISVKDIDNFQKQYYTSDRTLFIVVAQQYDQKVVDYIDKNTRLYRRKKNSNVCAFEKQSGQKQVIIHHTESDTITVGVNFKINGVNDTQFFYSNDALKHYLAGGWLSRLIQQLRNTHHLVYWADGEIENFSDTGYFRIVFSADKRKINKIFKIIFDELRTTKDRLMSDDDLAICKKSYISSVMRNTISPLDLLWWYGSVSCLGKKTETFSDYIEKIKEVTSKQIQESARMFLRRDRMTIAMIGNIYREDVVIGFE